MGVENPHYFTQKDLEPHLSLPPDCTWQRLVEQREVLAPKVLLDVLRYAKWFLAEEPGPNMYRRRELAREWFRIWEKQIPESLDILRDPRDFVASDKVMPFEEVANFLNKRQGASGVLFVAGAEGHAGHLHAASYMAGSVDYPVWVFEQDRYLLQKKRKAPFLPLAVRLSMWHYSPLAVLTVAPNRPPHLSEASHYANLFQRLGADFCFADEDDPHCEEKIKRGKPADFLIITHLPVERTTNRVKKLFDLEPAVKEESLNWIVRALLNGPKKQWYYMEPERLWEI